MEGVHRHQWKVLATTSSTGTHTVAYLWMTYGVLVL